MYFYHNLKEIYVKLVLINTPPNHKEVKMNEFDQKRKNFN